MQPSITSEVSDTEARRTRPSPLPSRLNDRDLDDHRAFVETLGEKAIWNKSA